MIWGNIFLNDTDILATNLPKKKRDRKSKGERDQWLRDQLELEENRPLFEKKNSEGKNVF
jgi:hypothetical protein